MQLQIFRPKILGCLTILCSLFYINLQAQSKKMLTPKDYKLWDSSPKIGRGEVSNDGNWISYRITNEIAKDTVYLRNRVSGLQSAFPITVFSDPFLYLYDNSSLNFSNNSKWFALRQGDTSIIVNLKTGKKDLIIGIADLTFTAESRYLLGLIKDSLGNRLLLRDLKTLETTIIKHVREYSLNADKSILGIITDEGDATHVKTILLKASLPVSELAIDKKPIFKSLKWNKSGTGLFFCEVAEGKQEKSIFQKVYVCTSLENKPKTNRFDPLMLQKISNSINPEFFLIELSDDGKQLFFRLHPNNSLDSGENSNKEINESDVQIWRSNHKILPPSEKRNPNTFPWYVWWVESDKLIEITTLENQFMFITGDQKNALVYNKNGYLPEYKYVNSFIDVYIKDMALGTNKLISKKVRDHYMDMHSSPGGKYVAYFKDKNWWIYDIYKNTNKCITAGLNITFENIEEVYNGTIAPFGSPGWLEDDSKIILYDQFDIWLLTPDGNEKVKLTNGRNSKTTFRVYDSGIPNKAIASGNGWFSSKPYSAKNGIFITSLNNYNLDKGFWNYNKKFGITKFLEKGKALTHLGKSDYQKPLLYIESDFENSPRLMLLHPSGKDEVIYQTNPQQQEFYWGKSELIHYKVDGKELKAALFYPANYDPKKKYPLVVEIYEKRSEELHNYVIPSSESRSRLNITSFTLDEYFVLLPDITYELNNPGISATKCVLAAVEKVTQNALIDKKQIGLMGHSFGGYETSFIITQTNIFKAAIAGAGITDLVDFYLGVSDFGINLTRVERDQFRMNAPFYSDAYKRNSPMDNIEHIKTPLLLWTGDKDNNVDWTQSRKFQIALWRLGKESTFLLYPEEIHFLRKDKNLKDLGTKMKDWFDYYLKDKPPAPWILGEQMK